MYSPSMFQLPPGVQSNHASQMMSASACTGELTTALTFTCSGDLNAQVWALLTRDESPMFKRTPDTISIMAGLERFDLIISVLHKLKNSHFISAEFAQHIVDQYPSREEGVRQWHSSLEGSISMEMCEDDVDESTSRKRRWCDI